MPKASIIITTHNRPHLLARAINSARASGRDVEVVVVDDASSDETAKLCRGISGINYVRVERNQGVAGARNVGLVASRGEYITFLDDDDVRLRDSVDLQTQILEAHPEAGLNYGQAIPEDSDGRQLEAYPTSCPQGDILWELLTHNFIPCGAAVFRRACLSRIGLLDDSISGIDDWDLWVRIAEVFSIVAINAPVMVWRQSTPTSGQGSSRTVALIALSSRQFRKQWLKLPRVAKAPKREQRQAWRSFSNQIADHLVWEAFDSLRKADLRHARASALAALRLHPASLPGVLRRWTSTATLNTLLGATFSRGGIARAKTHFKQIRSSKSQL